MKESSDSTKLRKNFNRLNSFSQYGETINSAIEESIINQENLNNTIENKRNEISKNMEILLKKLEDDNNSHIQIIESSNLTDEEKKKEYIKCLEELDKISLLTNLLENCIEKSEENYIKFLKQPFEENKNNIIRFLVEEEENLKKNNIYNQLSEENKYVEKIFNDTKLNYLKNYISNTRLLREENNIEIKKLKVNENSDLGNVREMFISINKKNKIMQSKLEKISLENLSEENLNYLINNIFTHITDINAGKTKDIHTPNKRKEILSTEPSPKELVDNNIDLNYTFPIIIMKNCDCYHFNFGETFQKLKKLKLISCELPKLLNDINYNSNHFSNIIEIIFKF